MSEPLVCAVMLTRDRPAMAKRAVECFRSQTYERKRLLIVNSGPAPLLARETGLDEWPQESEPCFVGCDAKSIGALRNLGNRYAAGHYIRSADSVEIFAHFDDDDYSNPNRLAEQVALLQASGADVVGYSEMVFWDEKNAPGHHGVPLLDRSPEAWLYTGRPPQVLGTSLCYWASAWRGKPFKDTNNGEDLAWVSGLKLRTVSSIGHPANAHEDGSGELPRMIASVHGNNTATAINPTLREWKRAPQWDSFCHKHMRLEAK